MNGYPDPYSFGDTRKIERMLKRDKTEFKMEELKKEEGDNGNEKPCQSRRESTV